jgi:hypothetical protein
MLGVYANRSNGRWAEGRSWALPQLYDPSRLAQQLGGAQAAVFRDQVLRLIRSGGLAVQVRGCKEARGSGSHWKGVGEGEGRWLMTEGLWV